MEDFYDNNKNPVPMDPKNKPKGLRATLIGISIMITALIILILSTT